MEWMPSSFARFATFGAFMSRTVTSHEEQATRFTMSMVSWHTGHPALKTSILRMSVIVTSTLREKKHLTD